MSKTIINTAFLAIIVYGVYCLTQGTKLPVWGLYAALCLVGLKECLVNKFHWIACVPIVGLSLTAIAWPFVTEQPIPNWLDIAIIASVFWLVISQYSIMIYAAKYRPPADTSDVLANKNSPKPTLKAHAEIEK